MYIKEESIYTLIIEKSKFIAYLEPCFSEEEYKAFLKNIKKKHYDANHVCSGFISNNIKRSADDGEPSGTAGIPIVSAIDKSNLNNTACFVVRYFGGIKLGTGGLIRAYGQVTSEAIKQAIKVEDEIINKYEIILSYELANKIDYLLTKDTTIISKDYTENVKYIFLTNDLNIIEKIKESTKGLTPTLIGNEVIQRVL